MDTNTPREKTGFAAGRPLGYGSRDSSSARLLPERALSRRTIRICEECQGVGCLLCIDGKMLVDTEARGLLDVELVALDLKAALLPAYFAGPHLVEWELAALHIRQNFGAEPPHR